MKKAVGLFKNIKKRMGRWFWVILAILLLFVWRIIASANKTTKVQVVQVTRGELTESVSTSGTVKADQNSTLTFPAGGKVVWVGVKAGDVVSKGQGIAQVDSVVLNAAYESALNNYRSTQAAVDLEHDNDKNYGVAETFAQKATRTAAEVANDNAYNAVLAARDNLANAVLTAPFNGIVDTVSPSSAGVQVAPGVANYTVVNPDSVYFDAEVAETDIPNVTVGQMANIKLDAYPNENFSGKVTSIGIIAFISSTGGNAYHIRVSLPKNTGLKFKVGMQGDVDIVFDTLSNVNKVLSTTITTDSDISYVWVISSGRAKKVDVTLGASSADETEIKSGLEMGSQVIDNPPSNLKVGQKVSI